MSDGTTAAASSTAPIPNEIELNAEQRKHWQMTGELPEEKPEAETEKAETEKAETEKAGAEKEPLADRPPAEVSARKLKKTARDRIQDLVRDKRALEARISQYEQRQQQAPAGEERPRQAPATREKPQVNDSNADGTAKYASYDNFAEDLADWKAEQRIAQFRAELQSDREKQERATKIEQDNWEVARNWQDRVNRAKSRYPNIVQELRELPKESIPAGGVIDRWILESPDGVGIAHYFHAHPQELAALAAQMPFAQARELTRIEMRISDKDTKPVTRAPRPPREVSGTGAGGADEVAAAIENNDVRSYIALENARELKARRGG
jgi:hypothetical protein